MMVCQWIVLFLSLLGICVCKIPTSSVRKLYNNLTSNYDPRLRPRHDQNESVATYIVARPVIVSEVDTTTQTMSVFVYFSFAWFDNFLTWNTTEYDGKDSLILNLGEIWHPKLKIILSTSSSINLDDSSDSVTVQHNGLVVWTTDDVITVYCIMNIEFYPFDTQACDIVLNIRSTFLDEVNLQTVSNEVDTSLMIDNPQWHLLDVLSRTETEFKNTIVYRFLFRRRAAFIVYTTIIPLILLSTLNACVVLVPVGSGEKGSMAVTLLLSYCVYVTAISESLPPNSKQTSYLLLYMTIVQSFSAITMLFSIIETRLYIYVSPNCCFSSFTGNKSNSLSNEKYEEDNSRADATDKTQSDTPVGTKEGANRFRTLDIVIFCISVIANTAVVIIFTVLAVNNVRDKQKIHV